MALNIRDPETDRVVRELVDATGESITVAVRTAVEERLRRVGRRHPAALNFGDCFADTLATSLGEPLLVRGDAFAQTDVISAR